RALDQRLGACVAHQRHQRVEGRPGERFKRLRLLLNPRPRPRKAIADEPRRKPRQIAPPDREWTQRVTQVARHPPEGVRAGDWNEGRWIKAPSVAEGRTLPWRIRIDQNDMMAET